VSADQRAALAQIPDGDQEGQAEDVADLGDRHQQARGPIGDTKRVAQGAEQRLRVIQVRDGSTAGHREQHHEAAADALRAASGIWACGPFRLTGFHTFKIARASERGAAAASGPPNWTRSGTARM
jgi:hypothetical protein